MSQIKTGRRLAKGTVPFSDDAQAPASYREEVLLPVTHGGDAIITTGASAAGSAVSIRDSATVTNAYVASSSVDMAQNARVSMRAVVTTTAADTIYLKAQWSQDGTNWSDEVMKKTGTPSGGEVQSDLLVDVVKIDASAANSFLSAYDRQARYFRVMVKSGAGTPKLSISAQLI